MDPVVELVGTGGGPVSVSWNFLVDGVAVRVTHDWGIGSNWMVTDTREKEYARRYRGLSTREAVVAAYPYLAPFLS